MASILHSSQAPQCISCLRRVTASSQRTSISKCIQSRGKTKVASTSNVMVRLLEDVTRFGRKGSIIPVPTGRMRNNFYPKNMAEYISREELKLIGKDSIPMERDFTFGLLQQRPVVETASELPARSGTSVELQADLLMPEEAMRILNRLVPKTLRIYRSPITQTVTKKVSPSIPSSSAVSESASQGSVTLNWTPDVTAFYGSVTTNDIAALIKVFLTGEIEGARVVLAPEDIQIVTELEEKDRVKKFGTYEIDVCVKGAKDSLRRTLKVIAQD